MLHTHRSWTTWMFVTAALLVPALMSAGGPGAAPDEPALRSTVEASERSEGPDAAAGQLDESAGAPGVCPVFCSTDAFCNAGCAIDSLCRNHRCVAF